jgi:DnaK suppressor protein
MDPQAREGAPEHTPLRLPELEPRLTPEDLAHIERHLAGQRRELLDGIARLAAHPTHDRTARFTPLAVLRGELEQTTRALARLGAGTYGVCQVCGQPIAPQRLAIVPSAERCDDCAAAAHTAPPAH